MIGDMQQPGSRGRPSSPGARRSRDREQPADDWLGDISEYDWSEHAAEHGEPDHATPSREGLVAVVDDTGWPTSGPVDAAEARRAVVERRRIVAGLVVAAVLGVVIVVALLLLRGGNGTPATPPATTTTPATTTPSTTPTPTQEPPTQQTPNTTPSTTTPATGASSFTLPGGTKLRLGEGDPGVVRELQQALITAGYDPGSVDGTFGPATEAAVTAFQQDNGLSADGVVGPDTAAALNSAIAAG
jgi:putative peptidoglycan binding protein